jgi:hypothetical protein
VPVTPVLAFVGSGVISVHGLPKDCLVATHRELDRLLIAGGARISPATASKLSAVANPRDVGQRPLPSGRRLPVVRRRTNGR